MLVTRAFYEVQHQKIEEARKLLQAIKRNYPDFTPPAALRPFVGE